MTTLTREWLKSQISSIEAVGITDSNTLQAFKIALAAMQQEPVDFEAWWNGPRWPEPLVERALKDTAREAWNAAMLQGKAEPVSNHDELPLDYLQGHKDGLEWAAQLAEANHPQTADWLYDDPIELAKAIRKGPDMPAVEAGNSPVIPDGWVMVPVEPTENMVVEGFESEPDEFFSDAEVWEAYDAMSGCQQAAHRAKLCWSAMIAAVPKKNANSV
ncbi:hypothetical protein [Yokenella regensburgei]|uniref:hypothetical protein n=1 Tax=Yokenella regensburgei TaxID=158877 RepID=UPI00289FB1F5|nr:hypothetical protein [Yokenella regensburgei]